MAAAMELLGSAPEAPYKAMPTNLEGQQRSNHVDTDQLLSACYRDGLCAGCAQKRHKTPLVKLVKPSA